MLRKGLIWERPQLLAVFCPTKCPSGWLDTSVYGLVIDRGLQENHRGWIPSATLDKDEGSPPLKCSRGMSERPLGSAPGTLA